MLEREKGLVDKKQRRQESERARPVWWWWLTKSHSQWCAWPWSVSCVVCVWHQLCVRVDGVVSDGKHHCGSVADAVCVCAMWCVCV